MTTAAPKIIKRPIVLRGGNKKILTSRAPEILAEHPAGCGVTTTVLHKVFLICSKYPGAVYLVARKTRASMTETILRSWEMDVVPRGHPILRGPSRSHRDTYEFPNGSTVVVRGMEHDKVDRIQSMNVDHAALFEATAGVTENDLEVVSSRIGRNGAVPYPQLIADANPGPRTHWLNQRALRDDPDRPGGKVMQRVRSRHMDNPLWHTGREWTDAGRAYMATLDRMTGHRRKRLKDGQWASAEGMVYPEFDADVHVVDPVEIRPEWRLFRAIDFGYTNPATCQWWAMDGDGQMRLYRELYETNLTARDLAERIVSLSGSERYEATVADPANADAREELRRAWIRTTTPDKAVIPGIADVRERLRIRGDGTPGLVLHRDALVSADPTLRESHSPVCLAEEFDAYVWKTTRDYHPDAEEPNKMYDHGQDALRYLCRYLAKPPARPAVL